MHKAVVIVDSFGQVTDRGPVYHTRGTVVELSNEEYERATDPTVHPPLGAVAPEGSKLAAEMSREIPVTANPDQARAHLAALADEHALRDPEGEPSDKEKTGVDAGVANSRRLAGRADDLGSLDTLDDDQLQALAEARGIDSKQDREALIAALSGTSSETGRTAARTRTRGSSKTKAAGTSKTGTAKTRGSRRGRKT